MRRLLVKLVVFVVLGAVTTVGVAWGICGPEGWSTSTDNSGKVVSYFPIDASDAELWDRYAPDNWPAPGSRTEYQECGAYTRSLPVVVEPGALSNDEVDLAEFVRRTGRFDLIPALLPDSARFRELLQRTGSVGVWASEYGWPLRCLTIDGWESRSNLGVISVGADGIILFDRTWPRRVVVPRLLINTFSYAFVLWLLWSAPFATRRLIRRRRGRCVRCGYDLRHADHDVCPECGR